MDKKIEKKISSIFIELPSSDYESFKHKCYSEGFSMKKAVSLLIEQYINDKIIVKE